MPYLLPAPAWAASLIIYQLHPDGFTPEGTWAAARQKLPYLADLGITALWLTPVYEPNTDPAYGCVPGRFCNFDVKEPDKLDPRYGSEEDFRDFVAEAHRLSLRVFLEIVPHGVTFNSTWVQDHPSYFRHNEQGEIVGSWGMADFDFQNPEFQRHWVENAVHFVRDYHVDGFRCDLEPMISGYDVWERVRLACLEEGHEILLFSEMKNDRRQAFLFEESGVGTRNDTQGCDDFLYEQSLPAVVQNGQQLPAQGKAGFYTVCMSNHDTYTYQLNGSLLRAGYELAFAPFLPVMYMGEEFTASNSATCSPRNVLFFNTLSWEEQSRHAVFTARLSSLLKLRRRFPYLLEPSGGPLNESNLLPVDSDALLPAYARFGAGEAVVILGHPGTGRPEWAPQSGNWTVEYGQLSQNRRDSLCANRLEVPLPPCVDILLDTELKLDPDQDMGGLVGLLLQEEGSVPDSRTGIFVGWNGTGRVFAYENGRFLCDRSTNHSPIHGGLLRVSVKDGRLSLCIGDRLQAKTAVDWRGGRLSLVTSRAHAHFRRIELMSDGAPVFSDDFIGPDRTVTAHLNTAAAHLEGAAFRVTDWLSPSVSDRVTAEDGRITLTRTLQGNTCAALHIVPLTPDSL